jgi:hypothetical protein
MYKYINMNIGETTFYEKINIYKLDYILKNQSKYEEIIKEQEKDMRRADKHYNAYAVFQKIKDNVFIPPEYKDTEYGLIKINYKKGKNSNNIGRWYANYGIGIQPLCCSVRHTICDGIWVDIDQVNSHPTILKHVMDKHKLKSKLTEEYLTNREEFLKNVMKDEKCSRDTAKTYVIAVINGAKYATSTLKKLYEELKPIINHIINLPEYKDIYDFVKITYTSNIEGKCISRILQIIENQLLELYLEFFNAKGFIEKYKKTGYITSLIFDGFQLIKSEGINNELLCECRKYAFDKTGYDIELKIKPFDNCLELPDDYKSTFNINDYKVICDKDEIIKDDGDDNLIDSADDDEGAANLVVKHYKDQLLICDKILYVYNNYIWNGDEKEVNKLLCNMITNLQIKFLGADNKRKYSYSSSVKHQKNCIIAIKNNSNIKINNDFINDLSFHNKYYLPFLNGVYSFKDKKLYEYEELSNIHFTHIINRELKPKNDDAYNELMTRIIEPIYPIENEKIYNAQIKARAIAGCVQDKTYYLQTGERNSGKGVETDLMKKAFDKYVKSFDTSSLIYNKYKVNDAKALSWLVERRFARVLIGNEIDKMDDDNKKMKETSILMNSKLLKQLVSGGDEVEARQNYKDEIQFKIGFTIFINSNDTFEFTTKDAGENLITLQYKSKFVGKDELIEGCKYYKLRDDNIKDLINEDRIINAYIHYIIDGFNDCIPKVPEEIKVSTETNNKPDGISVEQYIFNNFKNTNDKNDKLHIETIKTILNDNGFDVGNKITTLFTKLQIGVYDKNITIDKVKKAGFKNIVYTPITE